MEIENFATDSNKNIIKATTYLKEIEKEQVLENSEV